MGEFGTNSYNSADKIPPTAPNIQPQQDGGRFGEYILIGDNNRNNNGRKNVTLQGGISETGARTGLQGQGTRDNTARTTAPLQGNIQDSQLRASVNDSGGIPTYCLRIEDQQKHLDRPVFKSPFTGQVYQNVFIKQSDYDVVQRARQQGSMEQVNLYDNTGHLITPVYAAAVGGLFPVGYQPSTVVLNIFESPNMLAETTNHRSNNKYSAAIPDGIKQKYNKYKPFVQQLIKGIR